MPQLWEKPVVVLSFEHKILRSMRVRVLLLFTAYSNGLAALVAYSIDESQFVMPAIMVCGIAVTAYYVLPLFTRRIPK